MVQPAYKLSSILLTKDLNDRYFGVRKSPRNGVTNAIGKQKYTARKNASLEYLTWKRF